MEITLKLFASLTDHLPHERDGRARNGNALAIDVPDCTTVQSVIDEFRLPAASAHLVLVNGVFVPRAARATHALRSGDVLAIWPPVAGG